MSAWRFSPALPAALGLLSCVLAFQPHGHAQTVAAGPEAKLVVGTMRVPPFASRGDDGQWSGLSIELWREVAKDLKLPFEFREFDYDTEGLLNAVEKRDIDVAVAALPVTPEGEVRFDFSHPYFAAGLGIAVRVESNPGILGLMATLPWAQIAGTIAGLTVILLVVGGLVWLVERRRNPGHFDPNPVRGVGDGLWWAAVTMTTTGYGDKAPITWRGRGIALVWMFTSIFCIAAFSATLASSFVVGRLKTSVGGPADLPGARVGVVSGTGGENWAIGQGFKTQTFQFAIQASKALRRGEIDALIFERAILGHMIRDYAWTDLGVLPQTLAVRDYALAFPQGSVIQEDINRAILKVTQNEDWQALVKRYVGEAGP